MSLTYLSLTKPERDLAIAENIHAREVEWFHYDLNKKNYEALLADPVLAALPVEWPAEIAKYKSRKRDELVSEIKDEQTLATVLNFQLRDNLTRAARTETLERDRVEKYREPLLVQLPAGKDRDDAIAAAKAKREKELGITDAATRV